MAGRYIISLSVLLLFCASASAEESMASHERHESHRSARGDSDRTTDAELDANQSRIDNDIVDTSVDSCASGCEVPADIIGDVDPIEPGDR